LISPTSLMRQMACGGVRAAGGERRVAGVREVFSTWGRIVL